MAAEGAGGRSYRIILVEDDPLDRELVERALRKVSVPLEIVHVASEAAMKAALSGGRVDLVLSDVSLPSFSGPQALRLLRARAPGVPFILVSGTVSEQQAIGALQLGAVDYLLKDNLQRLPVAVEAALAAAARWREYEQAVEALRESDERFRAVVQASGAWIWEIDAALRIDYSNHEAQSLLGVEAAAVEGSPLTAWMHADDRAALQAKVAAALDARSGWRDPASRFLRPDGGVRWMEGSAVPRTDAQGAIDGFRGLYRDVTERVERESRIRELARFHAVLSEFSNAMLRATDVPSLLDRTCELIVQAGEFSVAMIAVSTGPNRMKVTAAAGDPRIIEFAIPRIEERREAERPSVQVLATGRPTADFDFTCPGDERSVKDHLTSIGVVNQMMLPIGRPPWAVLALASTRQHGFDAEELALLRRLAAEIDFARGAIEQSERLRWLAHHDLVSGLPNRAAIVAHLRTLDGQPYYVAALHLVDYRALHDVRGRQFADEVVAAIGRRFGELLAGRAEVAHLGGEYLLVAGAAPDHADALHSLERSLQQGSDAPVAVRDEVIHFSVRGGVACAPGHGGDLETLERHALSALAEAERSDHLLLEFNEQLRARAERRNLLERELRIAVAEEAFELHLQPKIHAVTGGLYGAEALMRWNHPTLGFVSPAEFIPLLESTGLITATGHWVMQTVYRLLRRWEREGLGQHRICVNVSAREFRQKGFVERCQAIFDGQSDGVDIEVTESVVMHDLQRTIDILAGLRALGCTISIDDFGTGYSSLNYLAKLPADILKIDRSFIAGMADSSETLALVTNIIALAHSLGLKVVAEGVETEEQAKLLRLLRCDMLQGYLLCRPLPVEAFEQRYLALAG